MLNMWNYLSYDRIFNTLLALMVVITSIVATSAQSADALSEYKLHSVQKELILKVLKELKSKQQLTDKEEQKLELYSLAQSFMEKTKIEQEKLKAILQREAKEPEEIKRIQKQVKDIPVLSIKEMALQYKRQSLDLLESRLKGKQENISRQQKKLATLSQKTTEERILPETHQKQLTQNQQRLINIQKQLAQLKSEIDVPQAEQKRLYLSAEIGFIEHQNETLSSEVQNSSMHLERLTLEQQWLSGMIKNTEQEIELLQNTINKKRRAASQALADNTEKTGDNLPQATLFQQLVSDNIALSQSLITITDRISQVTSMSQMVRNQLNTLTSIRNDIDQQSSLLGKSVLLARTLRDSLMHLPNIVTDRQIPELLTETRLQKFQYDQQRQQMNAPEQYLLTVQGGSFLEAQDREEVERLLDNRSKLLNNLSENAGKLITSALNLQLEQQRLHALSKDLSGTLQQKLFWVTSSQPLSFSWLLDMPVKLWNEVKVVPWKKGFSGLTGLLANNWYIVLLVFVVCAWLRFKRNRLTQWQKSIANHIGHIKQDSLLLTPWSLFLSLLYIAPAALFVAIFALFLLMHTQLSLVTVGYSLLCATGTWSIFAFLIHIVQISGVAHSHFQWTAQYCYRMSQQLRKLSHLLVPLTFLVILAENQTHELDQDIVGMILLMLGTLIQARLLFTLLQQMKHLLGSKAAHLLMMLLLPGLSLAQVCLVVMGYYYTALVLEYQILGTLALIAGFTLLQAFAIRSINIGEHRLAYQRAVKKYTATDNKPFEEPTLDLATVNQQSLRLLNAALIVGFAILFYWVWKNFSGVFSVMNTWTLWTYQTDNAINSVYLSNVLLAVAVLATTLILARNLPGLLEITVLSRLKIPQGNSYATTTLLSYSITSLGVILTLAFLGFSWDKLQWLVAAIGLGVSIGLREVFANILSGLIILFERPIRIGDTISLGELIGEVSRIRIRATTVVDWDHKEMIIPNSALLNEKLVNWSLSNSIIRIILPFHVTHDSDTALVERLLLQACKEHKSVAEAPLSVATLIEYGDSALFYELRIFITHVNHRLLVRNEINKRVTELFEEHGIKIAPQKRMLYFKHDENP